MRILMATRGSAGHILPLAPFAHACLRAGHDVIVAAQRQHRANVERAELAFAPLDDPPDHEWMPLLEDFGRLGIDAATARMVGDFFAGIDVAAALPGLRAIAEDARPDLVVRESWEFASALVAEQHGIPLVRVGLGLAAMEEQSIGWAAASVDEARAAVGLPADPDGDRLRDTPYLTMVPEPLEDPAAPVPRTTHRFRARPAPAAPLPADWWPGNDDPLVYVTFGSVTAAAHLPYYPALYRDVIAALAPLPVRVLLTIGDDRDRRELGPLPPRVRVEPWVPQDAVAPHAAAIVCHGGYGTTLGALAHGVPLVVLPLFSGDQWTTAAAVARAGAGVALDAERDTRTVLALPGAATHDRLPPAVQRVLDDAGYRREARRIADAIQALPPVDAAVDTLAAISGRGAASATPSRARSADHRTGRDAPRAGRRA
jgi:UDP:flavonoid glycosyltransferase YjiC (YdhE family)